ncbi:MAG TPA: hypothetical protein VEA61_01810 [Allosphingosinicella sp.]|nr:hypothetical protein [Allosphingosinicella sp.]
MPEPQKFHIGLIDLFSVWLPGALLTYVLQWDLQPCLDALGYPRPRAGIESWAVFLFVSYLAGHFIFVLGSLLLDPLDKHVRKAGEKAWEELKLKRSGKATVRDNETSPFLRRLSGHLFDEHDWEALDRIRSLKREHLSRVQADPTMNSFQWSKARLALGHSEALASVQRFEADSKFFRSLCVVLAILMLWSLAWWRWPLGLVALALLPGALWRFMELRGKSVSQAYWFVLSLEADPVAGEKTASGA